jgi:diguanylate cyclase (GGDEF)-like protein
MVCDSDYRITSIDSSLAMALEYSADQLVGYRAIDLVDSADRLAMITTARAATAGTEPMVTVGCSFLRRTGGSLPVQLAVSAFRSQHDDSRGLVCAVVATQGADGAAGAGADGREATLLGAARIAAVARADLLRLLHTAASAANASTTIEEAADAIVPSVCLHFGWQVGALVRWNGDSAGHVYPAHGCEAWPYDRPERPPSTGPRVRMQRGDQPLVVARVNDTAALVFAGAVDHAAIPAQALSAIAGDCARVADRQAALDRAQRTADNSRRRLTRRTADAAAAQVAAAQAATMQESARTTAQTTVRQRDVDNLTGLATRSQLVDELDRSLAARCNMAVLLVDLDDFKSVNDTHGHDTGDEVLVQVADRLRACVRPDDLVVRFGGDEFVVLCRVAEAAVTVAQRVVTLLAPPIVTTSGSVTITASVGISDGSIPVIAAAELLTRADAAMYWAKRLGKNRYFVYDDNLHAQAARDKQTETLLRSAVDENRVVVRYQPILSTMGTGIVGVEAVARLVDNDGRIRLPGDFLPVAERTGLIAAVDAWVLAESCRRIAAIGNRLGRPLTVSVNVSAQLAARPDLGDTVAAALSAAGLPASALMLELTEATLIQAGSTITDRLAALREQGVRVALDNFGAGYSPLAFLRRMPLSHVKVDRPCITRMLSDERDAAMLEAVTWLADQLGLTWIAEGVETDAQWEAVRRFGPGFAQGFLFAGPLAEDDLVRTLCAGPGATAHTNGKASFVTR